MIEKTIKILVIDDSRIMQNMLKNFFDEKEEWGKTEFLFASDGEEALKLLFSNKVDILFLDWNMPKLDGLSVLQKIRKTDNLKKLPVIMITSEAAKYNVLEAMKAGVTDYIIKPAQSSILREKVINYVLKGV